MGPTRRLLWRPFNPTSRTLMSKTNWLRLSPCPPLWGWIRLRNIKWLWVHWVSLLGWWRPLRRGCRRNGTLAGMHHLLNLTLLLSQSLDVTKKEKRTELASVFCYNKTEYFSLLQGSVMFIKETPDGRFCCLLHVSDPRTVVVPRTGKSETGKSPEGRA